MNQVKIFNGYHFVVERMTSKVKWRVLCDEAPVLACTWRLQSPGSGSVQMDCLSCAAREGKSYPVTCKACRKETRKFPIWYVHPEWGERDLAGFFESEFERSALDPLTSTLLTDVLLEQTVSLLRSSS